MSPDLYAVIATHAVFLITGYLIASNAGKWVGISWLATFGYFMHIFVGLLLWNNYSRVNIGDARAFVTYAGNFTGFTKEYVVLKKVEGKQGWPDLLIFLFKQLGYVPEIAIYINALAIALAACVIHLVCKNLNILTEKPVASIFVLFAPASIYWGSLPGREPICWLLISLMSYSASRLIYKVEVFPIVIMAIATIAMFPIRGSIAFGLFGMFIASIGLASQSSHQSTIVKRGVALVIVAATIPLAIDRGTQQFTGGQTIESVKASLTDANSSFISAEEAANSSTMSFQTLKIMPKVALGPLPWEWQPSLFLGIIDAIFWAMVFIFCYLGLRRTKRYELMKLYLLPYSIAVFTMSATLANYGIVMRMRGMMIPIIAPIFALAFVNTQLTNILKPIKTENLFRSNKAISGPNNSEPANEPALP